jgi:hypothetical protein
MLTGATLQPLKTRTDFYWYCAAIIAALVAVVFPVAASASGALTIDSSRDLYWAVRIARGEALPLIGPPVGSINLLGPAWFYLLAGVWAVTGSISAYLGLVGFLLAMKYPLALWIGNKLGGAKGAFFLVCACMLSGLSTYQWISASHSQGVETTLWLCIALSVLLSERRHISLVSAFLGFAVSLAFHAHPTTALLWPLLALPLLTLGKTHRMRALIAGVAGFALLFLPSVVAMVSPSAPEASQINAAGVSGIGGSIGAVPMLLGNVLWGQTEAVIRTFSSAAMPHSFAIAMLIAYITVVFFGLLISLQKRVGRRIVLSTITGLLLLIVVLALLRNHIPFYMCYSALPPLVLLAAYGLSTTHAWAKNGGFKALVTVVAMLPLVVHASLAVGLMERGRAGWLVSSLPVHSNMAEPASAERFETLFNARSLDQFARWLCAQRDAVALHSDMVAWYDLSVGLAERRHCPSQTPRVALGGGDNAWIGLPTKVWRELGAQPQHRFGGYGITAASAVIAPDTAMPAVTGQTYPPRYSDMVSGVRAAPWSINIDTPADTLLVVSHMLLTSPLFRIEARIGGSDVTPMLTFANTSIFRCIDRAKGSKAAWQVTVYGAKPAFVSITRLDGVPSSATLNVKSGVPFRP